jgi:hypothetical protein
LGETIDNHSSIQVGWNGNSTIANGNELNNICIFPQLPSVTGNASSVEFVSPVARRGTASSVQLISPAGRCQTFIQSND